MHSTFTTEIARQIVNDRLREADTRRLARSTRRGRKAALQADAAGSGSTERVVRRAPRLFRNDVIGVR